MDLRYFLLDVFTDQPFGGNQLAVFSEVPTLSTELMQRIARELNLSETVFVVPARDPAALCRLRIFTPGSEIPFAGHPTIGTAQLLVDLGLAGEAVRVHRFALEEEAGLVRVTVRIEPDRLPFIELTAALHPSPGPKAPSARAMAALLGLKEVEVLAGEDAPQAVTAGVPFLFVPVSDRGALGRARLDLGRWGAELSEWWAPHLYLFCRGQEPDGPVVYARMFAPAMGIAEDPATGAAAAAFGGYLAWREPLADGTLTWRVRQGVEMGRPSLMRIEADKIGGVVQRVRVGGTCVRMGEGVLRVAGE